MTDASTKSGDAAALAPVLRRTIGEEVVDTIRQAIISGTFAAGEHLAEVALSQQLQVSRAPVREAMMRLEGEGLLIFDRRGAALVRDFTATDLEEIFSLRLALEGMAARLACRHFDADFAAACERNLEKTRGATRLIDLSLLDVEFHDLIMRCARHARLYAAWANLRHQIEVWLGRMYARLDMSPDKTHDLMVRHHGKILQILRSGDAERAEKVIRKHIERWHRRHLKPDRSREPGDAQPS
jgi:DNA-binding GntR family transcriptional regulator